MMGWVTLLLGEDSFKVSRLDLISKSEYFAALFSPNFRDSQNSEHCINYDIHTDTLQTFVDWISDRVASAVCDHRCVKPSLAKYVGDLTDFEELLQLLQLGVLFGADALVKDLTDLIACRQLSPEKSIKVWLLAKELGLKTLSDYAKATCINRIHEVPESSFLELSEEDFVELAGNIRVQFTETDSSYGLRYKLLERWLERNVLPGESDAFMSRYPFTLLLNEKLDCATQARPIHGDQCWRRNIQCIVGQKRTLDHEVIKCVYGWDGITFSEIVELRSSPVWTSNIVGPQLVARGFDIYLVGGEYGKGSEDFQKEIWRYSMITKSWYYVTRMPEPRRHMAVTFVDAMLLIAGGRGQRQACLRSMDVYNTDTGEWVKASEARESFTNESLMWLDEYILTFYNTKSVKTHSYYCKYLSHIWTSYFDDEFSFRNDDPTADPDLRTKSDDTESDNEDEDEDEEKVENEADYDRLREFDSDDSEGDRYHYKYRYISERDYESNEGNIHPKFTMAHDNRLYVLGSYEDNMCGLKLFEFSGSHDGSLYFIGNCSRDSFDNQVANGPSLVGFKLTGDGTLRVTVVKIDGSERSTDSSIVYEKKRNDILDLCPDDPIGCFNVYNPAGLNVLCVVAEEEATE